MKSIAQGSDERVQVEVGTIVTVVGTLVDRDELPMATACRRSLAGD